MLHWFDSDIVSLCSYGSSSCCIGLIVTLLMCFLVAHPHVVFDWLWYCLSVFSWFYHMLHWIDCGIVYLCSRWPSSCSIVLIVTVFICVLMVLPHVALDRLWHCLSVFPWFVLMCCSELILTLFICVLMVLPHDALDWLWHCLSVFLWFFLMLHWIDCDIVNLCSNGSTLCCIGLIVVLFICVIMVLHVAFDWLWHC